MAQTRREVLSLYKRILNTARKWNSVSGDSTECKIEKQYIKEETRMLFKRNKEVTDQEEIKEFIREGETRLELALHYRTPYPRPVNIPQSTLPPGNFKMKKAQKRVIEQSKPIYIKSYKDNT